MARPDRLIRSALRTRYLVTTTEDEAFEGVLFDADDSHLILADAAQLSPTGDRISIDGKLWLPRINVKYMQDLHA